MRHRMHIVMVVMAGLAAGLTTSCEHETPGEEPAMVEAGVDGVAVRPMPVMDAALAERVLRDGAVGATADITFDESLVAESAGSSGLAEDESDFNEVDSEAGASSVESRHDPNS